MWILLEKNSLLERKIKRLILATKESGMLQVQFIP